MARPVLATLFPHLSTIVQPLSGEFGGRRELLERLPFVRGYGVDIGLLIDARRDRGRRWHGPGRPRHPRHRNRDARELGPQALTVLQTALDRAGVPVGQPGHPVRPGLPPLVRAFAELPPAATLRRAGTGPPSPAPSLA